jgi:acyl-CoA synthetase (AMP-forming)/AMP-acid ligase II
MYRSPMTSTRSCTCARGTGEPEWITDSTERSAFGGHRISAANAADLITWTRDRLAHYKCPVGVTFTAALARTASGKLQKQAIRSSLATSAVP